MNRNRNTFPCFSKKSWTCCLIVVVVKTKIKVEMQRGTQA